MSLTVKDLIEKLKKLNPETIVVIPVIDGSLNFNTYRSPDVYIDTLTVRSDLVVTDEYGVSGIKIKRAVIG